jgi:drug/metabolite transporter (DMT)-like permease
VVSKAFWIVFVSTVAYALITWGNGYLDGSVVSAFFVLQPVAAAATSSLVVLLSAPPHHGLHGPGWQHLGAFGVFGGLFLILSDNTSKKKVRHENELVEPLSGRVVGLS